MILARPARLLALAMMTLTACAKKTAATDPAPPPDATAKAGEDPPLALPVVGDAVIKGDLILTVNATGQISSEAISSTRAETGGTVQEVLIKPGDKVTKGQALAKVDTRLLDMDVKQAEANLATATMSFNNALLDDSLNRFVSTPTRRAMLRAQARGESRW